MGDLVSWNKMIRALLLISSLSTVATASNPAQILTEHCPCTQRLLCPRSFGENEDQVSRQILQVLPPCLGGQIRCCDRQSMFNAIGSILGDAGAGRSLLNAAAGRSLNTNFGLGGISAGGGGIGLEGRLIAAAGGFATGRQQANADFLLGVAAGSRLAGGQQHVVASGARNLDGFGTASLGNLALQQQPSFRLGGALPSVVAPPPPPATLVVGPAIPA